MRADHGKRFPRGVRQFSVIVPAAQQRGVIDVFESQAKLDAFGAKLMPILRDMGIEAKLTVFEIYNIIEGQ